MMTKIAEASSKVKPFLMILQILSLPGELSKSGISQKCQSHFNRGLLLALVAPICWFPVCFKSGGRASAEDLLSPDCFHFANERFTVAKIADD